MLFQRVAGLEGALGAIFREAAANGESPLHAAQRRAQRVIEERRPRVIYPRVNAVVRWLPPVTRWMMDRFTPPLSSNN